MVQVYLLRLMIFVIVLVVVVIVDVALSVTGKTSKIIKRKRLLTKKYVSTFRNLLHKEQKETTVRYERYSQYGSTLKITTANNTASLEIHGIHDARPPVREFIPHA